MKTKIILTKEELKNSDYSRFEINIRLDDDCHNGHDDFSITAMGRYKDHTDKYDPWDIGGCCHDEIMKLRPDLKPFIDLHLSNSKGQPMYAVENGYYHLTKSEKSVTKEYLRITDNEYDILKNSGDKLHFVMQLETLGIIERWQEEANKAIKLLESMTGEVYKDSTTKETFKRLTEEQRKDIENKLSEGYYTDEEIKKRTERAKEEKKLRKINDIQERLKNEINKLQTDANVRIAVLNAGYSIDNFIYYNHTNKGVFNWLDYYDKITKDDLKNLLKVIDWDKLPKDIKFELK